MMCRLNVPTVRGFSVSWLSIMAFKEETALHSNVITRKRDGEVSTVVTTEGKTSNRIYMLKHDDAVSPRSATVTIIIRMKGK